MTRRLVLQLAIFVGAGLLVAWPSIDYPWYEDDLHLIRVFSADELRSSWTRSWDQDGFESPGYRPLTVLFNHARASAFDENRAAHRAFVIVLVAIYLVLIGMIGRRFRLTTAAMTLAGVLMLCAKYSSYHLVWISDGVHAAQGILFALAAIAMLRWVESESARWFAASTAFFVMSVLLREDSLATVPVLVGMSILHSRQVGRWPRERARLIAYALVLAIISISVLLVRQAVLTPATTPLWTTARNVVLHLVQVVTLAGWAPLVLAGAFLVIFLLLVLATLKSKGEEAGDAWMWLAFAFVSSSAGIVESRVNLMFFPVTFYCVFAAHVLSRCAAGHTRLAAGWDRPLAIAIALLCIVLPLRESRRQQLSMASGAENVVFTNCDIARQGEWAAVTSPRRRAAALRSLNLLGLHAGNCASFWDESGALKRRMRLPPGMFVPRSPFLSR